MMIDVVAYKAVDLAFGEVISAAVARIMGSHLDGARSILIEEFRNANITEEQVSQCDDVLGMMISYATAARQHSAFRNLRLLAQVLAHKAVQPEARKDDFVMWADMIGGLLPEEVVVLAAIHRHTEAHQGVMYRNNSPRKFVRQDAVAELVGEGRLCASSEQLQAIGGGLLRTGCLIPVFEGENGMFFYPSFRMAELVKMVRLNQAAEQALDELKLRP